MTVLLPQPIPSTSGWQLVDWLDDSYSSAPAGSGGTATITLPSLDTVTRWQLTHAVAFCSTTANPAMRMYLSSTVPNQLRDGTDAGKFAVADWPMGLMVPPAQNLIAVWSGCNAGDVATLNLQANIFRLVSS